MSSAACQTASMSSQAVSCGAVLNPKRIGRTLCPEAPSPTPGIARAPSAGWREGVGVAGSVAGMLAAETGGALQPRSWVQRLLITFNCLLIVGCMAAAGFAGYFYYRFESIPRLEFGPDILGPI